MIVAFNYGVCNIGVTCEDVLVLLGLCECINLSSAVPLLVNELLVIHSAKN